MARIPHYYDQPPRVPPRGPPSFTGSDSKRRSWADMVAESEDASTTISELSFGNQQTENVMGQRRRSWLNLMESDENLHKVSQNPNGKMKIVTVDDQKQLKKANKDSGNDSSSRTGSMASEFVLVPRSFVSNSKLATTEAQQNLSLKNQDNTDKRQLTYRWSKKRCLLFCLAFVVLVILAVIIGLLVKHTTRTLAIFEFKWTPPAYVTAHRPETENQQNLRLTFLGADKAVFHMFGQFPFQNVKTIMDFKSKKVIAVEGSLAEHKYCFLTQLNVSLTRDNLQDAAESTIESDYQPKTGWQKDWSLEVDPRDGFLPEHMRESVVPDIEDCKGGKLVWLDKTGKNNTKRHKCRNCWEFCLPDYGINYEDELAVLNVIRRYCFYIYVPEWGKYDSKEEAPKFYEYYKNGFHTTTPPSKSKWITIKVPQNNINLLNHFDPNDPRNFPLPSDTRLNRDQPQTTFEPTTTREVFTSTRTPFVTVTPQQNGANNGGWIRINNGQ